MFRVSKRERSADKRRGCYGETIRHGSVGIATCGVAERRRSGSPIVFYPRPKTVAAMKLNNTPTIDGLVQAMDDGIAALDTDVLQELKDLREEETRVKMEATLLEATEQKFGAKPEYAKTLGNWARGIQKKFVDGLILHRKEDPHTKIHWIKVGIASSMVDE